MNEAENSFSTKSRCFSFICCNSISDRDKAFSITNDKSYTSQDLNRKP